MSLSAYELQRLKNIERNDAVLESLGLSSASTKMKRSRNGESIINHNYDEEEEEDTKPKAEAKRKQPKRGSGSSISYSDFFAQSNDQLDELERQERIQERQRNRRTNARPISYADEQADEIEKKDNAAQKRRTAAKQALQAMHHQARPRVTHQQLGVVRQIPLPVPAENDFFSSFSGLTAPDMPICRSWPVQGVRGIDTGICPTCKAEFKLNKADPVTGVRSIRSHRPCVPPS